ncbi:MAG: UDP-N-acetylmuramoyl-L-alanyl-D-glutamate--2,6-diaminopimelate ligase [Chlorobiaceae bacterium]
MSISSESVGKRDVQLDELLKGIDYLELAGNIKTGTTISMVSNDSRELLPSSMFVAVRGYCADGHSFISSAIDRGAIAVICEEFPSETGGISCLFIKVSDTRQVLAVVAKLFYRNASDQLMIIGVTGTNGKTTTARLITDILNANGIPAGYIGTNLCRIAGQSIALDRTTPEAHGLHALFAQMVEAGCRATVMEVSSHALILKRVYGIQFHAAVFTNLTMEHLDFHETMEAYTLAKQQLFDQLSPDGFAVFNIDDPFALQMAARLMPQKIYYCTLQAGLCPILGCSRYFLAEIIRRTLVSTTVALHFPDVIVTIQLKLLGLFNVMNMLEAAAVGFGFGLVPDEICRVLSEVTVIEGRMERVGASGSGWHVFVDYAHTPDALFKALSTLRKLKSESSILFVVFGCGGNRDKTKRFEMGRVASEVADEVIITSDNPRDEDPESILDEIERGIIGNRYMRISNRSDAIRKAVSMLKSGDILLVAGKGHEKYQEVAGRKEFFSDRECLLTCMYGNCSGYLEKENSL